MNQRHCLTSAACALAVLSVTTLCEGAYAQGNFRPAQNLSVGTNPISIAVADSYGKLPLSFEANQGQTDAQVKFLSRSTGYTLFLTRNQAVFVLRGSKSRNDASRERHELRPGPVAPTTNAVLRMKLHNAKRTAKVTGVDELPGRSNYFVGNDQRKWGASVPTYTKVKYEGIYSGIDLVYYGNQRQLEFDFVVAPGTDPRHIQFDIRGARSVSQDKDGDLLLEVAEGELRWHKPVVYQEKGGARQEVAARYVIKRKNRIGFAFADYDLRRPLFIDPLIYSTYLGGSGQDAGAGIAIDSSGNAYVTGSTTSVNFPTMNPLRASNAGGYDAFVAKLNPAGSALVYSTYLGGSGDDFGNVITLDGSGDAYVTGYTASTDFPTMNPVQASNAGGYDVFVAKLNSTGSALVYSTLLGGSANDYGAGIALDGSGSAYVVGGTASTDFPRMSPLQPNYAGGQSDTFVAKLDPTGSALVYSTYLGGSGADIDYGIAVNGSGNAYVSGFTQSTDFPTMNPLQASNAGGWDVFVAQLNATGSALVYSTYLGGSLDDQCFALALDSSGNAYVPGYAESTDFPTMNPLQVSNAGGRDAFVAKLNPAGSALVYSTYLGGNGEDLAESIAADISGNVYVTGFTASTNFPTMNPVQAFNAGGRDAFVAKLDPAGSALVYSTYLGGKNDEDVETIAADNSGNAYVTGRTFSTDFPTVNPLQPSSGGNTTHAFVFKISTQPSAAVTLAAPSLDFGNQVVGTASTQQTSTLTNRGELALTITSIDVVGPNSGDFVQTNDCGLSLPAAGSCQIGVTFTPSAAGTRTAAVSITDNAAGSPQSVPLTGVGLQAAVTVSPTSISFPNQYVGTSGLPQTLTVTNTGTATLTVTNVTTSLADFGTLSNCTSSVAPNTNCTIGVFFDPTASGVRTGTLSITDNAGDSPQTVTLSGTGQDFSLAPSGPTTATVTPGQTASYAVAVTSGGGFNQTVAISCSGAPALSTCSVSPSSVALSGSTGAVVNVTITTAGGSAGFTQPFSHPPYGGTLSWLAFSGTLALAMLLSLASWRRERRPTILYGLALLCLLSIGVTMSACGGSSGGGNSGTPAGTYNLTVTGRFTSGSTTLTHNTNLTLVVR